MRRRHSPLTVCALIVVVSALLKLPGLSAADPKPELSSVALSQPGVGDITRLLHINKLGGSAQFSADVHQARLSFEVYRAGDPKPAPLGLETTLEVKGGGNQARFAVLAADLDYLPLGNAKPGLCKFRCELEITSGAGGMVGLAFNEGDLTKAAFDLSQATAVAPLDWKQANAGRRPLFCLILGPVKTISASVDELIAKNPGASFLVAYLDFQ